MKKIIKLMTSVLLIVTCSFAMYGCKDSEEVLKETGLPNYEDSVNTKIMGIGGWNPPPAPHNIGGCDANPTNFSTQERYNEMADCGLNIAIPIYENAQNRLTVVKEAMTYADNAKMKYIVMDSNFRQESYSSSITKEDMLRKASAYKDMPAFLGHHIFDEPSKELFNSLGKMKKTYQEAFPDKMFYVNLFPSYASTSQLMADSYTDYVDSYMDIVEPNVISLDNYHLQMNGNEKVLGKTILRDYEINARYAKSKGLPFMTYIQTLSYNATSRQPTEDEIRFSVYTSMLFGIDAYQYWTYWQPFEQSIVENENKYAMVRKDGTLTDVWHSAKKVNTEIKKFDNVYLNYDWEGIMTNIGTNNEKGKNMAFSTMKYPILKHNRIKNIKSSEDLAIGVFKDKDGFDGFLALNYNDPGYTSIKNNVEFNFKNTNKVIAYIDGEKSVLDVKEGKLKLDLKAGQAVFLIPVCIL